MSAIKLSRSALRAILKQEKRVKALMKKSQELSPHGYRGTTAQKSLRAKQARQVDRVLHRDQRFGREMGAHLKSGDLKKKDVKAAVKYGGYSLKRK